MNPTEFDLDLFFSPIFYHKKTSPLLLHLATAGGIVSEKVYKNPVHDNIRYKIKNMPMNLKLRYELSPKIEHIIQLKTERYRYNDDFKFDKEAYLHDFIEYAKSGCFSFDRTNINDPELNNYHLVAYPIIDKKYFETLEFILGIHLPTYHLLKRSNYIYSESNIDNLTNGCRLYSDGLCQINNRCEYYGVPLYLG
ncbi:MULTISPECIES: hypothetical protein [unclassified Aeromonas]|uniref:hypothetical protein n=1 Tax=unclassified Aeromonas TaxID=257493 RepID=UPI0022DFB58D|nr:MULTISPECIES: hypothetical protein [unclassified Aeromonas]